MKLLVADDDPVTRRLLEGVLGTLGFEVVLARTAPRRWQSWTGDDPPPMAILDWMMPGMTGRRRLPNVARPGRLPARPTCSS